MKRILLFSLIAFLFVARLSAKEGMWIPILLEKYNLAEMQSMGFKLTAQDIYDVNQASMKDAVVIFGGGCTGELISPDGLLITNHHCGYGQIQKHSSIEHDYLTNGFWAMNRGEELPNPGLSVRFLEYMEDVTDKLMEGVEGLSEVEKTKKMDANSAEIRKKASADGKFVAQVKPLFYGNQYFLYVYKIYTDVRLVGAPPSAIGKFGGDTDNWMWPRHTGDFSLFRVYANNDNEPAAYSPDNVPFKPKKYFPVSMKGIQPGDFTMVFGYPGSTMQYIPSQEVDLILNQRDPDKVAIRDVKLDIIGADMEADPKVRIQYAAKYAGISNSWKKWQGEMKGLNRLDAVNKKLDFEAAFEAWAKENGTWESMYQPVFENFDLLYQRYKTYVKAADYYGEIVFRGPEIFQLAGQFDRIFTAIEKSDTLINRYAKESTLNFLSAFAKDFNPATDEKLFAELLPMLVRGIDPQFLPEGFAEKLQKIGYDNLMEKIYHKSVLADTSKLQSLLQNASDKRLLKLKKDPLIALFNQLKSKYHNDILPVVEHTSDEITANMKTYMAGIMEMKKGLPLYADANMTLRVAYGKVEGYAPVDGVQYRYYTTLSGIMEKDNPAIYDYDVPERLKELYRDKDFGRYEVNGDVPVCFTASNHTTGGNSGSPVVNAEGQLIGVNFDRGWEGTMSDIMYDPDQCRNIAIDIRYALFLIDKFAGAGYLLDEMEIVE